MNIFHDHLAFAVNSCFDPQPPHVCHGAWFVRVGCDFFHAICGLCCDTATSNVSGRPYSIARTDLWMCAGSAEIRQTTCENKTTMQTNPCSFKHAETDIFLCLESAISLLHSRMWRVPFFQCEGLSVATFCECSCETWWHFFHSVESDTSETSQACEKAYHGH